MVTIAIAVMFIAAIAIVAWPFLGPARPFSSALKRSDNATIENLIVQRDATYAAIKDLEFDRAMGKLSEADFKAMRAKYEAKAVTILQELDEQVAARRSSRKRSRGPDAAEVIERQVQQLRARPAKDPSDGQGSETVNCPRCGAAHGPGDAFCGKCGEPLRGARCPNCGMRAAVGDRFCANCGAQVGSPAAAS